MCPPQEECCCCCCCVPGSIGERCQAGVLGGNQARSVIAGGREPAPTSVLRPPAPSSSAQPCSLTAQLPSRRGGTCGASRRKLDQARNPPAKPPLVACAAALGWIPLCETLNFAIVWVSNQLLHLGPYVLPHLGSPIILKLNAGFAVRLSRTPPHRATTSLFSGRLISRVIAHTPVGIRLWSTTRDLRQAIWWVSKGWRCQSELMKQPNDGVFVICSQPLGTPKGLC